MCTAYALHVSHPSRCVVVIIWGIPWMSQVLDLSLASNIFTAPCSSTLVSLVSVSGFIFKATTVACWVFCCTPRCTEMVVHENPYDYYLITSCWISSVVWHMLSQHISGYVTVCDPPFIVLVCTTTSLRVLWHLAALDIRLELLGLYRNLAVPMWCLPTSI